MTTTHQLDPRLAGYLIKNRDFVAPAVDQAIGSLGIAQGARTLDAGTGAGGAVPPLARAVGPTGSITAVDLNLATLSLARDHARQVGVATDVVFECADVFAVLSRSTGSPKTLRDRGFDAIWAGDVVWPGNFDDPSAIVRSFAEALRPGGSVALFYSNYYQATFLPGHSRLERLLRTASETRWGLPADGPHHYERHLTWLLGAGLEDVTLRVFPRIGFPVDADPTVLPYLESAVWPELIESATSHGTDAGLSTDDLDVVTQLLTPGSDRYVVHEPGFFVVHPTILATGRRPAS